MSFKEDFIEKHGKDAYAKRLERRREWGANLPGGEKQRSQDRRDADPEQAREYDRAWRDRNPQKIIEKGKKVSRKGGKYYKKQQVYKQTGLQGERNKIRYKHANQWRKYKRIIAQDSQVHHQWQKASAEYDGIALVEANKHRYGIIDIIQILEGEITILTEREILEQKI